MLLGKVKVARSQHSLIKNHGSWSSQIEIGFDIQMNFFFFLQKMKGQEILRFLVEENQRLSKPARCPDEVYEIMLECWKYE